jgi:prepilin-type N-terminal cleavage/methylation domain-containing protein
MQRPHGFTVIELLVVIAIITIVTAILFPVFAQAREKARAITCMAHAKQAGVAIAMYEQDFDDTVIPCGVWHQPGTQSNATISNWQDLLVPYVRAANAFLCPSRSATVSDHRTHFPPGIGPGRRTLRYSWACNDWEVNRKGMWGNNFESVLLGPMGFVYSLGKPAIVPVAAIEEPSNTILLAEAATSEVWTARCHFDWLPDEQRPFRDVQERVDRYWGPLRGFINFRHHGGFNAIFADNHARWLKRTTGPDIWSIRKGVRLVGGSGCEDRVEW